MTLRRLIAPCFALALLVASQAAAQVNPGTSPLSGAKGGTDNAFMQFAGPVTSLKTFTLPNASDTIATLAAVRTWTGAQSFTDGTLILLGSSSGSSTLKAPATGGGIATLFAGSDTVVGRVSTDTLANKALTAPAITGGTAVALTGFGIRSSGAAFDLRFAATEVLTADRTLTWVLGDASRSITLAGNVSLGGAFTMSGAFGFTGTLSGTTSVTFPTAGTLATLAGSETLANKILTTPVIGSATPTAAGAVGFGSNQLNWGDGAVNRSGVSLDQTQTLTNKTFNCANNTCTVRLGSDVTGQLPIGNGGTGQATAAAAITALIPAATRAGDLVYWNGSNWVTLAGNNSGTQILTENASGVPSWAATGSVSSVTCGTGLTGGTITTTGTCALALNSATLQAAPGNPTGTTSATGVMMGMGATCHITPVYSTRVKVEFFTTANNTASTGVLGITAKFGTGVAPSNGAAITGTSVGTLVQSANPVINNPTSLATGGIITGLTPATAYWFDLVLATNAGSNGQITNVSCNAMEF